jgi:hypothetical protein
MIRTKSVLASVAAAGLLFANPAFAASSRSSDPLPSVAAMVPVDVTRASSPVEDSSELGAGVGFVFYALALAALIALVVVISDGGDNDTAG